MPFYHFAAHYLSLYPNIFDFDDDQTEKLWDSADSTGVYGRLICSNGETWQVRNYYWWFVQPDAPLSTTEWSFYSRIVPAFAQMGTVHDILPFALCKTDERMVSIKLHQPHDFYEAQLAGQLDQLHLSLMAATIGQFHAYSLQLVDEGIQHLSMGLYPYKLQLDFCQQAVPILQRCCDLLLSKGIPAECQFGVSQLLYVINNLSQMLNALARREHCGYEVFSHQNYTRDQVTFSYENDEPQKCRIVEWTTVGWTSLGVDLATLLYVECDSLARRRYKCTLMIHYYRALKTSFDHNFRLPTWNDVMAEVKKCIPVVLCTLAERNSHSSGLWNDDFIVEVLEDLVEVYSVV